MYQFSDEGAKYSGIIIMKQRYCTPSIVLLFFLKCNQKRSMEKADKLLKHVVNCEEKKKKTIITPPFLLINPCFTSHNMSLVCDLWPQFGIKNQGFSLKPPQKFNL